MENGKPTREADLLNYLRQGQVRFPPLAISQIEPEVRREVGGRYVILDALLTFRWVQREYPFAVEGRWLSTPRSLRDAIDTLRRKCSGTSLNPLVLVPYLGKEQLATLEAESVSGLDLCGNGIVVVPGELLVYRTGFPNRFPRSEPIKNVYRKNSSMVARVFLLRPDFGTVKEALKEITCRGGSVTLATVSKVCASLEEDLILQRSRDAETRGRRLRLLQPEKLLDRLAENYEPPQVTATFTGKTSLAADELRDAVASWAEATGGRAALTGACSTGAYAVMAREPLQAFYCSDLRGLLGWLGERVRETPRFANVSLLETRDEFVYFDRRPGLTASPVQTYLELASGDKRDRETAEQVRRAILVPLSSSGAKGS